MEAIKFNNYYKNLGYINYKNNLCTYNNYYNNRNNKSYLELKEAIELIKKSIDDEKKHKKFYDLLVSLTNNKEDIDIINSIIVDKKRHNEMLKKIYFELTENKLVEDRKDDFKDNMLNYRKNLEKALMDELDAIKKYRKIMAAMPDKKKYSVIMEILTDELRHANLYNFLITKNTSGI